MMMHVRKPRMMNKFVQEGKNVDALAHATLVLSSREHHRSRWSW